jgi:hypothetical protein
MESDGVLVSSSSKRMTCIFQAAIFGAIRGPALKPVIVAAVEATKKFHRPPPFSVDYYEDRHRHIQQLESS